MRSPACPSLPRLAGTGAVDAPPSLLSAAASRAGDPAGLLGAALLPDRQLEALQLGFRMGYAACLALSGGGPAPRPDGAAGPSTQRQSAAVALLADARYSGLAQPVAPSAADASRKRKAHTAQTPAAPSGGEHAGDGGEPHPRARSGAAPNTAAIGCVQTFLSAGSSPHAERRAGLLASASALSVDAGAPAVSPILGPAMGGMGTGMPDLELPGPGVAALEAGTAALTAPAQALPEARGAAESGADERGVRSFVDMVRSDPGALVEIPPRYRTPEVCRIALQGNALLFEHVPLASLDREMCLAFVRMTGQLARVPLALRGRDVCLAALQVRIDALLDVPQHLQLDAEVIRVALSVTTRGLSLLPGVGQSAGESA